MSRHKNDIPGTLNPTIRDVGFQDAMFESSDVAAGHGVTLDHMEAASSRDGETGRIAGEPCMLLRSDPELPGVLLGMMGQSLHLATLTLATENSFGEHGFAGFQVDCEFDGVSMAPGEERHTHWLLLFAFQNELDALNRYADMFACHNRIPPPPACPPSLYCSWYYYGLGFGEKELHENLAELKKRPVPFDVFMIDGSWMDDFGSWQPNTMWAGGMEKAATEIRAGGYEPGIWTCPFVVMADSPVLQKYPDLVARNKEGKPCLFGYQGPPCYVVDVTAPSAKLYFDELYGRLADWGYHYHKFDFLRSIITAHDICFHDLSMTRTQAYRHGLRLIREATGPEAYILACGGLFEGSAGLVDAVRTSSDTVGDWSRAGYAENRPVCSVTCKQNIFRSYTGRFWHTDPDALMLRLREEPWDADWPHLSLGTLTDEEAFTLLAVQFLCGGIACIGERFAELSQSRYALLRHLIPSVGAPARPLDWHNPECPSLFVSRIESATSGLEPWLVLTVINWENTHEMRHVPMDFIPREWATAAMFDFHKQQCVGIQRRGDSLKVVLPPRSTRVFRLTRWDGVTPVILGTDAHISGGGHELRHVTIDNNTIAGQVESPWRNVPVTVSAAFPRGKTYDVEKAVVQPGTAFRMECVPI